MTMPTGLLDAMSDVLKAEDRATRRANAKARAKGHH
jgi:hypothetical protein